MLAQLDRSHLASGVRFRIEPLQPFPLRLSFRARLLDRRAAAETTHHGKRLLPPLGFLWAIQRERNPEILARVRKAEMGRHDANDGVRLFVELQEAAQGNGIRAEFPPPETIAQDHDSILARLLFIWGKSASHCGRHAQRVEKICAGAYAWDLHGIALCGESQTDSLIGAQLVEDLAVPQIKIVGGRQRLVVFAGRSVLDNRD